MIRYSWSFLHLVGLTLHQSVFSSQMIALSSGQLFGRSLKPK